MKKWFAFTAAILFSTIVAAQEKVDLMNRKTWDASTQKRVIFAENSITSTIPFFMMRTPIMSIDPAKEYKISLKAKGEGGTPVIRIGFRCFTADNKMINAQNVLDQKGTFTTLAAKASKGDKVLKVKNASAWKPYGYLALAINAKEDFSDLPNFDIAVCAPVKIEKTGDFWTVTLKQPLPKDIPAGTGIRQHIRGGLFFVAPQVKADKDFITITATVKGHATSGYTLTGFPRGTAKAIFFIQTNATGLKSVKTILKDAAITVK
ncbi:MAG: hypothetical protein IJW23_06650 [Lentisphaeria bacterium]|nr:hypothetical protein [Lentisphaeria bacterium]